MVIRWERSNFCRIISIIKNPFSAKAINNQLEKCVKRADEVSSHESLLHTYTLCSIIFEDTQKKILKEMLRLLKQLQKIKTGDANSYCEVKEQLFALVSLFPNKALAKKLVKTFIKSDKYSFGLVLRSDSLELLSKIPHEALTEKEINAFLTKRMFLAEYLIKSIEPETLAERFLLLNGTNSSHPVAEEIIVILHAAPPQAGIIAPPSTELMPWEYSRHSFSSSRSKSSPLSDMW